MRGSSDHTFISISIYKQLECFHSTQHLRSHQYFSNATISYHKCDDTILATLLERVFDELHMNSRYSSGLMKLLSLYDLQAQNLRQLDVVKASVMLFKKVVNIRMTTLNENHSDRLTSQHELVHAYEADDQIKQAIQLSEQIVKIEKITLTEHHSNRLTSQHALAGAYIVNGQITEAAELLRRLQRIQVNLLDQSKKQAKFTISVLMAFAKYLCAFER
jgi:hypothetical protein